MKLKNYKVTDIGGDLVNWTIPAPTLQDAAQIALTRVDEGEEFTIQHSRGATLFIAELNRLDIRKGCKAKRLESWEN